MGFMELQIVCKRAVRFYEPGNCCFVVGLAKLSKQVAHVVYGSFHGEYLTFSSRDGGAVICWNKLDGVLAGKFGCYFFSGIFMPGSQ